MATTGTQKSLAPTRKWVAAQVVAVSAILVAYATAGVWSAELTVAVIGWLTQAATTWLVPNLDTPGGVPTKPVEVPEDYVG